MIRIESALLCTLFRFCCFHCALDALQIHVTWIDMNCQTAAVQCLTGTAALLGLERRACQMSDGSVRSKKTEC
jgi:hypothetical protein